MCLFLYFVKESGTSVYSSSSTTSSSWERERRFHSVKCEPPSKFLIVLTLHDITQYEYFKCDVGK